jgi:hypothetical protein
MNNTWCWPGYTDVVDPHWTDEKRYQPMGALLDDLLAKEKISKYRDDLIGDVAKIATEHARKEFTKEITKRFRRMCKELKAIGYKEVWVGPSPYSSTLIYMSMIFAAPKLYFDYNQDPWHEKHLHNIADKYFPLACGNGLSECDQWQTQFDFPRSLAGRHIL